MRRPSYFKLCRRPFAVLFLILASLAVAPLARSQASPTPPAQQQPDQAGPDSGGPGSDSGVIALPKKKDAPEETPPPAPAEPKVKNPEGMPTYSLRVDVPEVTVEAVGLVGMNG